MTTQQSPDTELRYRWPPRIIFNTDGCLVFKYLCRRNPDDVTEMMVPLADTCVDVVSVLVGVNDDLSWRGSPHGELWGETMGNDIAQVLPGGDLSASPAADAIIGSSDVLQMNLKAMVDDGHDVFQLFVDRARQVGLGIFASFRMNDAHCNMEHRMADARRSAMKVEHPDWLIGSPTADPAGYAHDFNFCWQWNWAREEVRHRFLGLMDETLTRYDVDGLELDFCRTPPFFKPHQALKHIDSMTAFIREAQGLGAKHAQRRGREVKLLCRVPSSLDAAFEVGLDVENWIGEGIVDLIAISSSGGMRPHNDAARAVAAAASSGTLVYVGSGGTYPASPQNGYEDGHPTLRHAIAHNAYKQGAAGVHLFNHDYANHRAQPVAEGDVSEMEAREYPPIYHGRIGPFASDRYTHLDLQTLRDLGDPEALGSLDRCYQQEPAGYLGDHVNQVPRKLALAGRGAGEEHAMRFQLEDDVEGGLASGRIRKTELRLRLTEYEENFARIVCQVNGRPMNLQEAGRIQNSKGEEWLVVDAPPIRQGENSVLVMMDGSESPRGWQKAPGVGRGWPTLHQCELVIRCEGHD
jgi:hypothetical protein